MTLRLPLRVSHLPQMRHRQHLPLLQLLRQPRRLPLFPRQVPHLHLHQHLLVLHWFLEYLHLTPVLDQRRYYHLAHKDGCRHCFRLSYLFEHHKLSQCYGHCRALHWSEYWCNCGRDWCWYCSHRSHCPRDCVLYRTSFGFYLIFS